MASKYMTEVTELVDAVAAAIEPTAKAEAMDTLVRRIVGDVLEDGSEHDLVTGSELSDKVEEVLEEKIEGYVEEALKNERDGVVRESDLPDFDDFVKREELHADIDWDDAIRGNDLVRESDLPDFDNFVKREELTDLVQKDDLAALMDSDELDEIHDRFAKLEAVTQRGFLGRLKWLLTGK